jgi:hypothetical protein
MSVCTDRVGAPMASLIHPAHPLMHAVTDLVLEQHRNKLKQGAVLVDHADDLGLTPRVLFIIDHAVKEGTRPGQSGLPPHAVCGDRPRAVRLSTPDGRPTWTCSRHQRVRPGA